MFGMRVSVALCLFVLALSGALMTGCPCQNTLKVENETLFPISAVYVRLEGADDWGDNELSNTILPGETENIRDLLPGCYDVRVVYLGIADDEETICLLCQESYTLHAGDK